MTFPHEVVECRDPYDVAVDAIGVCIDQINAELKAGYSAARSSRVNMSGTPIDGMYWRSTTDWKQVLHLLEVMRRFHGYGSMFSLLSSDDWEKARIACRREDRVIVNEYLLRLMDQITDPANKQKWLDSVGA